MFMLQAIAENSFLFITIMVFITVFLLLQGFYLIWKAYKGPNAKVIEQRLKALSASLDTGVEAQLLKQRLLSDVPAIERLLLDLPRAHHLQRIIHQAGLEWTVSRLILSCLAFGFLSFIAITAMAHQSSLTGSVAAILVAITPLLYIQRRRRRRLWKIEQQLPDALDLMSRALRSGHAFSSSLQMLGEETMEPIKSEFQIVHDEVNFGVSLEQALINLSERVPITDLRYFVVSVLIQRESGGNLTEVLSNLSRLIRERLKLLSKIRVLSAEGRMSAWILAVMPFALAGILNAFNPEFMNPFWTDPLGISIIKYLFILMALGIIVMIKIIKIRV
jgi:tight adherence protein B